METLKRPMPGVDDEAIFQLRDLFKDYDDITGAIQRVKNRWATTHKGVNPMFHPLLGNEDGTKGLESLKGRASRLLEKQLRLWPLWSEWLVKVPGVGQSTAASLILAFYYRFMPVCQECGDILYRDEGAMKCSGCGKEAKGDGVLKCIPQDNLGIRVLFLRIIGKK